MENFLAPTLRALPQIKTVVQYGFSILTLLVFLVLMISSNTPTIALIFVFSVVPLLIAMRFIEGLKPIFQFVIVLIITLMALAFLGTGIALAAFDKTSSYDAEYHSLEPVYDSLATKYLLNNSREVMSSQGYPEYRKIVLDIYYSGNTGDSLLINRLVNFYNNYLQCRQRFQCSNSKGYNQRMKAFWYTFRPIIEDCRAGLQGKEFGRMVQDIAESEYPPMYDSTVVIDKNNKLVLKSRKPIDRSTSAFQKIFNSIF